MALLRQTFLKPGFYGTAETGLREITRGDLRRYTADTNAALASGLPIPLLDEHCPVTALDEPGADSYKTRGWLKKVIQHDDGSVLHETEVTDADTEKRISDGSIRFVSPQLNPSFAKNGKDYGSIFRHIALTPKPVNPDQGKMVLTLSEGQKAQPFAVSLKQYKPTLEPVQMADDDKKKNPFDDDEAADTDTTDTPPADPAPNIENEIADELPTNDTVVTEETEDTAGIGELLMKLVEALAAPVPEGTDLATPEGQRVAISVMLGKASAAEETTEETVVDPIEPDTPGVSQFSDDPVIQQLAEQVQALQAKNAAQAHKHNLARLHATISAKGYPDPLKKELLSYATGAVQFAENGTDKSRLSITQVIDIIDRNIPANILQLAEAAVAEAVGSEEHPDKEFFNDKDDRNSGTQQEAAKEAQGALSARGRRVREPETIEVTHRGQDVTAPKARAKTKKK